jgi:hypothetical protein
MALLWTVKKKKEKEKMKETKWVPKTEEKYHQEIKNNSFGVQYEL